MLVLCIYSIFLIRSAPLFRYTSDSEGASYKPSESCEFRFRISKQGRGQIRGFGPSKVSSSTIEF